MALKIQCKTEDIFHRKVSFFLRTIHNPSTSVEKKSIEVVIPRAVYDYASMVNHTFESPRQNKLDHDVSTILGSSDPPAGFGFLHPRFYYLEQKRPIPLQPLQVSFVSEKEMNSFNKSLFLILSSKYIFNKEKRNEVKSTIDFVRMCFFTSHFFFTSIS